MQCRVNSSPDTITPAARSLWSDFSVLYNTGYPGCACNRMLDDRSCAWALNVLKPETAESIWPRGPTAVARNRETGKDQRLLLFTKSLQTIGKRHRAWQRLL